MALTAILNVTIGLILFWLALSLAVYQLSDWMSITQLRTAEKELRKAIGTMLQDEDLLNKFYAQRVIRELTPKRTGVPFKFPARMYVFPIVRGFAKPKDIFPSIISSDDFAEAMFNTLIHDGLTPEEVKEGLSIPRIQTSIERLKSRKPHLTDIVDELFLGLDKLGYPEQRMAECKEAIKKWYRRGTANLEESRRQVEARTAFVIGSMLVLLFNIDAVQMASYFWREPTIREVLVQNAANFDLPQQELQSDPEAAIRQFDQQFVGLRIPIGWSLTSGVSSSIMDPNCQLFPRINQSFGVPIISTTSCISQSSLAGETNLLAKAFGLFISALAGQQGAPLWSNIVRRLFIRIQQV